MSYELMRYSNVWSNTQSRIIIARYVHVLPITFPTFFLFVRASVSNISQEYKTGQLTWRVIRYLAPIC